MTARLEIRLLGGVSLHLDDGRVVTLPPRPRALLIHLLLARGLPQPRQHIAFRFWPDSTEKQARSNLSYLIHQLRTAVPELTPFLSVTHHTLHWREELPLTLDVARFLKAVNAGHHAEEMGAHDAAREAFGQAVRWYTGDLAPGDEEDFVVYEREALRQRYRLALERLIALLLQAGELHEAIQYAEALIHHEPLYEPGYCSLMQLYARLGDQSRVHQSYRACRESLQQHLGLSPSPITEAAYQQALHPHQRSAPPAPRLPVPTTAFLGRTEELAHLRALLEQLAPRLITLLGPGGIGKTRLALQVALNEAHRFRDGVAWVALAAVNDGARLAAALGEGVGAGPHADPVVALLEALRGRECLLVLDTMEHLVEEAALISTILQQAPRVRLLVTSRVRLKLHDESVWEVGGLDLPHHDGGGPPEQSSAATLFTQSARRARMDWAPTTAADQDAVARICALVQGNPLALELAAAWIRHLPLGEIATELARDLDFLESTLADMPPRHRSLRVVFEHSWEGLSPPEQRLLRQLSLFRGGFTREAAAAVAGATLPHLAQLSDRSLLTRSTFDGSETRYTLHELVRQYAFRKLEVAGEVAPASDRHLTYFMGLAEAGEAHRASAQQALWLARFTLEHDNLRAALDWALGGGAVETGVRLAAALWWYWETRGHWQEGLQWLEAALARPETVAPSVRARGYNAAGNLARVRGEPQRAADHHQESLRLRRLVGDGPGIADSLNNLGLVALDQGEYEQSWRYQRESLTLRAPDEVGAISRALHNLGYTAYMQGHYQEARQYYEEDLLLKRRLENRRGLAHLLNNLGRVALAQGQLDEAARLYDEALAICQDLNDGNGIALTLKNQAQLALARHEFAQAQTLLEQSLHRFHQLNNQHELIVCLETFAQVAAGAQAWSLALLLLAGAHGARARLRLPLPLASRQAQDDLLAQVRHHLDSGEAELVWQMGTTLSLAHLVARVVPSGQPI